jgi:cation diffusion facilitator CzcD-associated flavoprotein CzcO
MNFRELIYHAVTDDDSDLAATLRGGCTDMMKTQLPGQPELWEKLTPNYAPGCKRVIISDDYYPALARDNVELETRPITQITRESIEVGAEDSQQYDLIVLATGFRTVEFMHPIQIYGKNGRSLGEIWKDGAMAYKGVTVEDLPNFGMFYGPNTNLGMIHLPFAG